ncbi:MAG: FMN-binding protein [Vallitaleaceae bacterium]|jgi:uncharacterized protein with FMN-binding domain|nr:FMN-binding protein [Vallitaleaceae bacterium]
MSKKKKAVILIIGIFAVIIIISSVVISKIAKDFEDDMAELIIHDVDMSKLPDGIYEGSYNTIAIKVIVEVAIEDGQIKNIELIKHQNGQGDAAEAILPIVQKEQSLEVEVISGATYSSKSILKAIENALTSNKE